MAFETSPLWTWLQAQIAYYEAHPDECRRHDQAICDRLDAGLPPFDDPDAPTVVGVEGFVEIVLAPPTELDRLLAIPCRLGADTNRKESP